MANLVMNAWADLGMPSGIGFDSRGARSCVIPSEVEGISSRGRGTEDVTQIVEILRSEPDWPSAQDDTAYAMSVRDYC